MSQGSAQLKEVYGRLVKYKSPTAGDFNLFMSALSRANEIYDAMPDQVEMRIKRAVVPRYYGKDQRESAFGLVKEAIVILDAIRVVSGYKLRDLCLGISEGFTRRQFRNAVLCCRALYEEAATAKYYCDQLTPAAQAVSLVAPSTFRVDRLRQLARDQPEKFKSFFETLSLPWTILKKWHGVREIDWRKPNFLDDHKLDKKDPLYPGFALSALKEVRWQEKIPATYYYAVLCEATHTNVLANTLYADDTSFTNDVELVYIIRKVPKTIEPFLVLFEYVSVPTIETVKILDDYIATMSELTRSLTKYLEKARRVTM
jgi:hypothetical protein